jgi:CheY-like chemotaxis protein
MNDITVLVAEEDERQALLITKALSQNKNVGHIISFQNAREVLNFLFGLSDCNVPGEKYVLILGVQLPQTSGIEILKVVKNHEAFKTLPVIIFSSAHDPQTLELCYRYGCNAFIHRPVGCDEFESLSMLNILSIMQIPDTPMELSKISSRKVL